MRDMDPEESVGNSLKFLQDDDEDNEEH